MIARRVSGIRAVTLRWGVVVAALTVTLLGAGPIFAGDFFEGLIAVVIVSFFLYLGFVKSMQGTVVFGATMILGLVGTVVWVYLQDNPPVGYAGPVARGLLPFLFLTALASIVGDRAIRDYLAHKGRDAAVSAEVAAGSRQET